MTIQVESKEQLQGLAKELQSKIGNVAPYKFYQYPFCNENFSILVTKLNDLDDYNCFISTNYSSGRIFLYLSDSEINQGCHLLASLMASGKSYKSEQVISLSDNYLGSKGFGGLMFIEPEDFELFGKLKSKFKFDGKSIKAVSIIPLKVNEFNDYKKRGIEAIIELFDSESRDYLSIN